MNPDTTKVKFQGAALDCISLHNLKKGNVIFFVKYARS